jgi:transcriptional regulator with XRE-family HTH domain
MEGKSLAEIRRARGADAAALEKAYRSIQLELPLAALRQESGVTQTEMAQRLGVTQAAVSKFEGRGDFLCSTLFRYVQTLGAELDVKIKLSNKKFDLVAKNHEADFFFTLAECAEAVESVVKTVVVKAPKKSEKIVSFKDFALAKQRQKKAAPSNQSWNEVPSHSREFELADLLLNITGKDENQSATA